jgi:hypothetical protein
VNRIVPGDWVRKQMKLEASNHQGKALTKSKAMSMTFTEFDNFGNRYSRWLTFVLNQKDW